MNKAISTSRTVWLVVFVILALIALTVVLASVTSDLISPG